MPEYDVAVVGASIAGSAVATLLGQEGRRVWLADCAGFPRPKVCGEGLMPEGVQLLKQLRTGTPLEERLQVHSFRGLKFHLPGNASLELLFSELERPVEGLVTDRSIFDQILLNQAKSILEVDFSEKTEVRSVSFHPHQVVVSTRGGDQITARLLVGANGIRSNLHLQAKLSRQIPRPRRMALRTYFSEVEDLDGMVEIFAANGAEAYLAPMGGGARITILFESGQCPDTGRNGAELREWYRRLLSHFPGLKGRVLHPVPDHVEATAPVSLFLSACHGQRLILVGDAAGASDPIAGQGMTQALKDAFLAHHVLGPLWKEDRFTNTDLSRYTYLRQREFARSVRIADDLLRFSRYPLLASRAVGVLSRKDTLRRKILNAVAGNGRGVLSRWEKVRLIAGI